MDLNQVRFFKSVYDKLEPEEKAKADAGAFKVRSWMAESFPVVTELDQAVFAWYMAKTLQALREIPVAMLSSVLEESANAYALTAVDLLGWHDL